MPAAGWLRLRECLYSSELLLAAPSARIAGALQARIAVSKELDMIREFEDWITRSGNEIERRLQNSGRSEPHEAVSWRTSLQREHRCMKLTQIAA
jgi:hypothetical protein